MSEADFRRQEPGRAPSFVALVLLVITIEFIYRAKRLGQLHGLTLLLAYALEPILSRYAAMRAWTLDHRILACFVFRKNALSARGGVP